MTEKIGVFADWKPGQLCALLAAAAAHGDIDMLNAVLPHINEVAHVNNALGWSFQQPEATKILENAREILQPA